MLARVRRVLERRWKAASDRGSHTTEIVIGITIVVAITAVVGPILTDAFTEAAQSIDLGITK